MITFLEYLKESLNIQEHIKGLDKDSLEKYINNQDNITGEQVKGILKHPDHDKVDALKKLVASTHKMTTEAVGLTTMHAMKEPRADIRNQHAYQLESGGKLNDTHRRMIAKAALGPVMDGGEFDEHLAKRLVHNAIDKQNVEGVVNAVRQMYKRT